MAPAWPPLELLSGSLREQAAPVSRQQSGGGGGAQAGSPQAQGRPSLLGGDLCEPNHFLPSGRSRVEGVTQPLRNIILLMKQCMLIADTKPRQMIKVTV